MTEGEAAKITKKL